MAVIKSVEEKYMKEALKQAKKAYALGEVPIGCASGRGNTPALSMGFSVAMTKKGSPGV